MTHGHFRGCLPFSFAGLKKPAIHIFFINLHLLSFPTIFCLPCFPLKRRGYEFFPGGHPRRSGVTLRFPLEINIILTKFNRIFYYLFIYPFIYSLFYFCYLFHPPSRTPRFGNSQTLTTAVTREKSLSD